MTEDIRSPSINLDQADNQDEDILDIDELEEYGPEINDEELEEDISEIESVNRADINKIDDLIKETKEVKDDGVIMDVDFSRNPEELEYAEEFNVIDDFIRNFFIKNKLNKSLEAFQQEWYEFAQRGLIDIKEIGPIPEVYLENQKLEEEAENLEKKLNEAQLVAEKARSTWDKLRRQKEHHKMHHHRIQQEKQKLNDIIEKKKNQHTINEQRYQELSTKYEAAMKEKIVLKMQKDKLISEKKATEGQIEDLRNKFELDKAEKEEKKEPEVVQTRKKPIKLTVIPPLPGENPYAHEASGSSQEPFPTKSLNHTKSTKGHMMAISAIAVHPKRPYFATASDDLTWKLWGKENWDLILSGEGHRDWISDVDFNPNGTSIASCSGDSTIRIMDFVRLELVQIFKEHIHPVWSISHHHTGDFLVSGSMDHSSRLFDINAGKSRGSFRGHVDSVNKVKFIPYTNTFASASADKSLSLWDIRSGLCVQTFYGHENALNSLDIDAGGEMIASCDADGVVKVWDVRMAREFAECNTGPYSANDVSWDWSSTILAVAGDDSLLRMVRLDGEQLKIEGRGQGHKDSIQGVAFERFSKKLISVGSDCEFKIWN